MVFSKYLPSNAVDGIFDATDSAVRQFQHDNRLYKDRIVGLHTWGETLNAVGTLTIKAIITPDHTDSHMVYMVIDVVS